MNPRDSPESSVAESKPLQVWDGYVCRVLLTGCSYFVKSSTSQVLDPLTIINPSQADFESSVRITSFKGFVYELYFGSVHRYTSQYSFSVLGEVFMDKAQEAVDSMKDQWLKDLRKCMMHGSLLRNLCNYGVE